MTRKATLIILLNLLVVCAAFAQTSVFTFQSKLKDSIAVNVQSAPAVAPTAFTYQGKLNDGTAPANGQYDLTISLYDATPTLLGSATGIVQVTAGIFTITIDGAGPLFTSDTARFLEIGVRPAGSTNPYTTLSPRQPIAASPYALRTMSATSADGLSAVCNPCITNGQLTAIDGAKVTGAITNATINSANISGVLSASQGGTGIGPAPPPAGGFLKSTGTGWTLGSVAVGDIPSGSGNYIQNTTSVQAATSFNVSETGAVGGTFSAGDIGAGTTSPASRLHLNGNSTNFAMTFTNAANTVGRRGYRISFDNDRFSFQRANDSGGFAANQMVIDQATGNVGIGTTDPTAMLTVAGTVQSSTGGFKFPDGSVQTAAAENNIYTNPRSTSAVINNEASFLHLDLPNGNYVLTAVVTLFNNTTFNQTAYCRFSPSDTTERFWSALVAPSNDGTISMHTVQTVSAGTVDVLCQSNGVSTNRRRLTAVRVAGSVIVQ